MFNEMGLRLWTLVAFLDRVPEPGQRDWLKTGMAGLFVTIGISAAVITVRLLREKLPPHDPYGEAFGDMPPIPTGSIERSEWL